MDSKEQIIVSLKRENDLLKAENEFLKNEFIKLTGNFPIQDAGLNEYNNQNIYLPPINNFKIGMDLPANGQNLPNDDIEKLKQENVQLKKSKEVSDRQNNKLINENMMLASKLNNLENVFIGSNILRNNDGSVTNEIGDNYNMSAVY
jgi:cell division protein FtsB